MPFLRLKLPDQPGERTHILEGPRITIGRGSHNTIQISDRSVSSRHAEFIEEHGHYRLHDLESTNLTCVDDVPITDCHLHTPCRLRFGTIEAEFSPETSIEAEAGRLDWAPTRAEIEFLKRDNRDLQQKVGDLERRIEILGLASLDRSDLSDAAVAAEVHRRVVEERDKLRAEVAALTIETENFQCDITAILRDRDALRQAWATVQAELAEAERELTQWRADGSALRGKAIVPRRNGRRSDPAAAANPVSQP
jgi:hypothetical protein